MRHIYLFLLISVTQIVNGQTFLKSYNAFYKTKIDQSNNVLISSPFDGDIKITRRAIKKAKKKQIALLQHQIEQFDTVFKNYKRTAGFDFNTTDSLTLIYQTGVESNLHDFIFISGVDTISYGETWLVESTRKTRKSIVYKPFLDTTKRPEGIKVVDVRDSLLTIAAKRNCDVIQRQIKDNKMFDGPNSTIIIAKKRSGNYDIDECVLGPFGFVPIWRKE